MLSNTPNYMYVPFLAQEASPSEVLPSGCVECLQPMVDEHYPVLLAGAGPTTKLRLLALVSNEQASKVFITHFCQCGRDVVTCETVICEG